MHVRSVCPLIGCEWLTAILESAKEHVAIASDRDLQAHLRAINDYQRKLEPLAWHFALVKGPYCFLELLNELFREFLTQSAIPENLRIDHRQ